MLDQQEIQSLREQRYNATVIGLRRVHSDLMILRIRPDFARPTHKPGQYCSLGLGYWEPRVADCQPEALTTEEQRKLILRAYSLSNTIVCDEGSAELRDMTQDDWVEFYIVLVRANADGRVPALTPRLFALQVGDRLKMFEKITGHYTLDPVKDGDTVIFLGTGTGEAPHNSMIWELLRRQHTGRIIQSCCVRHHEDLGYMNVHQQLMRQYQNYTYLPLVTRSPFQTRKVYIQDLITSGELERHLGQPLKPDSTHVYLCGNPSMIGVPVKDPVTGIRTYPASTGVIELLEQRGFQADRAAEKFKGNLHFEEYW
jgi:ferredoxin/flavodoxin---NADP+ reductase